MGIFFSLECEQPLIKNKFSWIPRKCVHHHIPAFFFVVSESDHNNLKFHSVR